MKTKLLAFGMILSMLFAMVVVPVIAETSGTCGANLTWTFDSGTLTISGTGAMRDYPRYSGVPWDSWRSSIKTVVIQNGVTSIGDYVFSYCSSLDSITIPDGVISIGVCAFYGCSSLASVTIPNGVANIGYRAFSSCNSLENITIPDSVTSIEGEVFSDCKSLTSITIPNRVADIGWGAFFDCNSLIAIEVNQNNQNYSSENGILFNKDKTTLIACPAGKAGSYTIPEGVTNIRDDAFRYCSNLENISIPESVTNIGDRAFLGCSSLENVTIPDSVISVGYGGFLACDNLTDITIGNGVTSIGEEAFSQCPATSISIGKSVTSIGKDAFFCCTYLKSITIPDSVMSIGMSAFYDCSSLTDVYYGGTASQWNAISIGAGNSYLTSATIFYNSIFANLLLNETDYNGETVSLPDGAVLDTGENLNFRNGYVNTGNGYVKAGDKKITGSNVHFASDGKIRLDAGDTAKVSRDNGDGTTDQGFIVGVFNPTGVIRMILEVTGEVSEVDYTGRTITKDFDFTNSEIYGLVNFGFEVKRVPKPLELAVQSIE